MKRQLTKTVQNTNARHALWKRGARLVLGVSGGIDSMCLLDIFTRLASKEDLLLTVVHVNYDMHHSADSAQKIVEDFCYENNITCVIEKVTNAEDGSESTWRDTRRKVFMDVQKKYDADHIVLGHTQNDQAETLLLHLMRGTGLKGLSGMQYKNHSIIRPLLDITREEIHSHQEKYAISFVEDPSNTDRKFTRNRVRHELLPLIAEKFNPSIIESLAATSQILTDAATEIERYVPLIWREKDGVITFSLSEFAALSESLQRMALHKIFEVCAPYKEVPFRALEDVRHMITHAKNKDQEKKLNFLIITVKGAKVRVTLNNEK